MEELAGLMIFENAITNCQEKPYENARIRDEFVNWVVEKVSGVMQ